MHGGAPRVRRRENMQTGAEIGGKEIVINQEALLNNVVDAAISAGVSIIVARAVAKRS